MVSRPSAGYLYLAPWFVSERAKGAEKAQCRETVVPTGVFGESVFFSAPLRFALKTSESLRTIGENRLSIFAFWMTVSPHDAFSTPLTHPHLLLPDYTPSHTISLFRSYVSH